MKNIAQYSKDNYLFPTPSFNKHHQLHQYIHFPNQFTARRTEMQVPQATTV
jgi:hypothetical protein